VVSDIVLLKNLPGFIKESVEAYIGCISGAILKNEYLALMKQAGFTDIIITDETSVPVELMIDDSITQEIKKKHHVTKQEIKNVGTCFVSIKVTGSKNK